MSIVTTSNGKVEGVSRKAGKVEAFLGIPYAAPPVGDRRWRAPEAPERWEGIRKCDHFPNYAMQARLSKELLAYMPYSEEWFVGENDVISEDCLYLNLWKPAGTRAGAKLPVLFIIHGGGFSAGSGSVVSLSGENMAEKGVLVVAINYRVGVFGFLAHPELSAESEYGVSGNYGILDQIAALKWVRDNIEAFGGDPENITISGESAGAISVEILYESPLAKGLFQKASAQSGSELLFTGMREDIGCPYARTLQEGEQEGLAFMGKMTCDDIAQLRGMRADELLASGYAPWPVRDDYVWPAKPDELLASCSQNDVPLLIGSNADEGTAFGVVLPGTKEDFLKKVQAVYGEKANECLCLYPIVDTDPGRAAQCEFRDRNWGYAMYHWARQQEAHGIANVFLYYYTHPTPGIAYGAFHSSELPYYYSNLDLMPSHWEEEDRKLSERMSAYLLNFVQTGNPNGEGLPEWIPFADVSDQIMKWDSDTGMVENPNLSAMKLLEQVFEGSERK